MANTPRYVPEDTQQLFIDCLVWFGRGRFVEDEDFDIHKNMVTAFEKGTQRTLPGEKRGALEDFLLWMDGGDRLCRIGPDNPYGENIEFNFGDYSYTGPEGRDVTCAKDMVKYYMEGD